MTDRTLTREPVTVARGAIVVKSPDEDLVVTFDFRDEVGRGRVEQSSWSAVNANCRGADDVRVSSPAISRDRLSTTVTLIGGSIGNHYVATNRVTVGQARIDRACIICVCLSV